MWLPALMVVALILLTVEARANATCMPAAVFRAGGQANGFVEAGALSAGDLGRALALYNATPPASAERFDAAEIMRHPDGRVAILFGRGGDLCTALVFQPEHWPTASRLIMGDPT